MQSFRPCFGYRSVGGGVQGIGSGHRGHSTVIDGLTTALRGVMDFIRVYSGNWEQAWEGIKTTFSGIWESLVGYVKLPINFIIDLNQAIQGFKIRYQTGCR